MVKRNGPPTEDESTTNEEKAAPISRRRLVQFAGLGFTGVAATAMTQNVNAQSTTDRLEIVSSGNDRVDYSFTATDSITPVENDSFASTESDEESVAQNDDGTMTATGQLKARYADAFDVTGDVVAFRPETGSYRLYLNGEHVSRSDLVSDRTRRLEIMTPDTGSVEYAMTTSGEITKVFTDTILSAEETNDVVTENADGTWTVTGLTGNGYGDTFDFAGEVLEFSPLTGDFSLSLDGETVTPHELVGEQRVYDREHSYSFEGVGNEWADVYLEVEDNGQMVASTLEGATIDPDYHWVSEDGTKAAARVFPDDRDTFQFDNLVLDVTIDGTADAYVDGSESSVDRYPQPGATGDGWKGGFFWQEEEEEDSPQQPPTDGVAMGGGSGYDSILTSADADYVVQSADGIQDALGSASSGDVVFVAGDGVIDTGSRSMDVPSGVTLASNRGLDGAPGALLYTDKTPQIMLRPQANARVTGLRLRGHSPGRTVTWQDGISFDTPTYAMRLEGGDVEVDNCEVWGWPDRAISVQHAGSHIHHNYIYDNNGQGLGYGVAAADDCLIEYNYFHNNRHSVTCAYDAPGYTARYNHFSPKSVMHICDIHDVVQGDTTIESNIIENGESRTWDNPAAEGIAGYSDGFDGGSLAVTSNWFFDQGSAYFENFSEVNDNGNVYGDEGAHDPADVVPNHPGLADRPWN
jgi:hypothetical protein